MALMTLAFSLALTAQTDTDGKKITLHVKGISVEALFKEINRQTGQNFIYNVKDILPLKAVDVDATDEPVASVLEKALSPQGVSFKFTEGSVIVKKAAIYPVSGRVTDMQTGEPLLGTSVFDRNTGIGVTTDLSGNYHINVAEGSVLVFSYLGYVSVERKITGSRTGLDIALVPTENVLTEVVATGIYTRPKESFTGSSQTYTVKELKTIGNQNVLQSLKTLDPAFAIVENNQYGSDPNRLPDVNVRGKTSVIGLQQEYDTDPNQPLFILDGFESTLAVISELNMDRVESITVLKDAAATAIYGSKAANGVIVVETKAPEAGRLRVSYSGNASVSFADLTDYNLMNAAEKLEFERLVGNYDLIEYNEHLAEIRRGVDTYWLSEPLRTALSHRHNLYVEGGDDKMRYGAGLSYGLTEGVMKGSDKDAVNGNVRLIYRNKRFLFQNYLTVDYSTADREKVAFSQFSRAIPYYRKMDENGDVQPILFNYNGYTTVYNPLYDMGLNSFSTTNGFGFNNNFETEWRATDDFRIRGRFSVALSTSRNKTFQSPYATMFYTTVETERGSYSETYSGNSRYEGDAGLTYGKLFREKHRVNAVTGMRIQRTYSNPTGYTVYGFIDDNYTSPTFSNGFVQGSKPRYSSSDVRSASYYLNSGYAFDNRYLVDFNYRYDGASVFGASRQWTTTWAVGLGWNLHNESFLRYQTAVSLLKLRASVGNPGNQNFDAYISMNIYGYTTTYPNLFGRTALITSWGNPDLKWQKTLDKNIGADIELFDRRIRLSLDYFVKDTDPLLVYVSAPASTGSTIAPMNIGRQVTEGLTGTLNVAILKQENMAWNVSLNARHFASEYRNIGNLLDEYNQAGLGVNLQRFYDGGSPDDLWAVRSAGIDPATGQELFISKDGEYTFTHSYADEVKVGNSMPDIEGVIGTSFYWRGVTASVNMRYRLGGQLFQSTLYEKVENISGGRLAYNQDKRALYDRWKEPGDKAKFKGISVTQTTPISSRFVADENTLAGESVSLGYEAQSPRWLQNMGAQAFTLRGYMNDIFRLSTVKEERGLDYPFARSVSFSLGLRF